MGVAFILRKQDRRRDDGAPADLENLYASIDRSQAVIEFDLEGRILKANQNFLSAMGYRLDEIAGRHHRMFVAPDYAASPDYDGFWRTLRSGQFIARKFQRFGKGGREVWIQASYNPVLDKAGKPYKVVKFATDVTEEERRRLGQEGEREQAEREQAAVVTCMADGLGRLGRRELTARIDPGEVGRYAQMAEDFNRALESLGQAFAAISEAAGGLSGGADQITAASDDLSRRTEQQAAGLEQTAASLDELTAAVKTTADNARRASDMVAAARAEADRSGAVVSRAVEAMGLIETSSSKISQIIGVIDEIAFQTNLLALNAGVEAARAGDAGKGFAVVASEVRSLAQRSAEAAKEIKALISTSTEQVGEGVNLVGAAGRALQAIGAKVLEIDSVVGDISGSAQEQSLGLTQINATVNQMDQATQQNAAMVEQAAAAAHAMRGETETLSDIVATFDVGAAARAAGRAAGPRLAGPASRPQPSPAETLRRKAAAAVGARLASDAR